MSLMIAASMLESTTACGISVPQVPRKDSDGSNKWNCTRLFVQRWGV